MKKYFGLMVLMMIGSYLAMSLTAQIKPLKVYMVRGAKAGSILDDVDYQNVFKDRIFAGHDVTIDLTSGKATFLSNFFQANVVYLSLHANPKKIVVGNGDEVDNNDLILAYKANGYKGPALVIVTGCSTTKDLEDPMSIPKTMGFRSDSKKKAYIGFSTFKVGVLGDRYFRVFLATWMKKRADGTYPTLEEARVEAKAFIKKMLGLQGDQTGKIARFAPLDASTADQFVIVGDDSLRVTDINP